METSVFLFITLAVVMIVRMVLKDRRDYFQYHNNRQH